jgi:hypothetical protein
VIKLIGGKNMARKKRNPDLVLIKTYIGKNELKALKHVAVDKEMSIDGLVKSIIYDYLKTKP